MAPFVPVASPHPSRTYAPAGLPWGHFVSAPWSLPHSPAGVGRGKGRHMTRVQEWRLLGFAIRTAFTYYWLPSTKSTSSCASKPRGLVVGSGDLPRETCSRGLQIQRETRAILRGWKGAGRGSQGRVAARRVALPYPAPPQLSESVSLHRQRRALPPPR